MTSEPRPIRRSHGPIRAVRDDAGVIAIIVALAMSTFLLGFAALAVDLGTAYETKAELQSIANRVALAGAKGLPTINGPGGALNQINNTLTQVCQDSATPGICLADGSLAGTGWETDGTTSNGEIRFFTDPDGDGKFSLTNLVTDLSTRDVTAVQVVLPPSTVQFGLAAAIGFSSADIHKSATARIGTPLGSGVLPFALTQADLTKGQFCVRGEPATSAPIWPGATPGLNVTLSIDPALGDVPNGQAGLTAQMTLTVNSGSSGLHNVWFHFSNSPDPIQAVQGISLTYDVPLPTGDPGAIAQVWATGTQGGPSGIPFVTNAELVQYTGVPPSGDGLCEAPEADRGYIQLARPATGNPLEQNIRSGPLINLYPDGGILGWSVGSLLNCAATTVLTATTCVTTILGTPFVNDLTAGLLTSSGKVSGRLIGDCGNGTMSGSRSGVDDSQLFIDPGFLNTQQHGSSGALKDKITAQPGSSPAASPDDQGWITSKALQCRRMAVMPVVDASNNITSLRYVWIDDDYVDRGLGGTGSQVTSMRGYIIDPGYLPSLVSGSNDVGPFLGPDMPREALLIPNLGGPVS